MGRPNVYAGLHYPVSNVECAKSNVTAMSPAVPASGSSLRNVLTDLPELVFEALRRRSHQHQEAMFGAQLNLQFSAQYLVSMEKEPGRDQLTGPRPRKPVTAVQFSK